MFTIRYFQSVYRHTQIRRENAEIAAQPGPSLLSLPDDLLLVILDILQDGDRDPWSVWHSLEHRKGDFIRLSTTCKRLRTLSRPSLFRTVHFGPSWSAEKMQRVLASIQHYELTRPYSADSAILPRTMNTKQLQQTLTTNPPPDSVTNHTRTLKIDHWSGPTTKQALLAAHDLVAWIQTLPRLENLSISTADSLAMPLKTAFHSASVVLPHIIELKISPSTEWIMAHCPNIRVLRTNDWISFGINRREREFKLISAAGKLSQLRYFSMHCNWYEDLLQHVVECIPNIKGLGMAGGIYNRTLDRVLKVLARFEHLERLDMVSAKQMDASTIPWITANLSAYDPPALRQRLLESDLGITPAQEDITRMVFQALPTLRELTLGKKFHAKRQHNMEKVVMTWEADPHVLTATRLMEMQVEGSQHVETASTFATIKEIVLEHWVPEGWEEIEYDEALRLFDHFYDEEDEELRRLEMEMSM